MIELNDIMAEPILRVGIMEPESVDFRLAGKFRSPAGVGEGMLHAKRVEGEVVVGEARGKRLRFEPDGEGCWFEIEGVTIGVNFHWERKEAQSFRGALVLEADPDSEDKLLVINDIGVEEYLKSVISSEMSATASANLLRAHAVMSRSWVLRQLGGGSIGGGFNPDSERMVEIGGERVREITRWYDRDNHRHYDVCADDHCQRYQGITRQSTRRVAEAVEQTRGQVLTFRGEIADARFHKCCGGVTEEFGNCWEPVEHPYLCRVEDHPDGVEEDFCANPPAEVLRQVLNDYDRESHDFYRWRVEYAPGELEEILREKSGTDLGEILLLEPLERGCSGRIVRLLIEGTRGKVIVGKELEIRRWLSRSHLRSSWFSPSRSAEGGWILEGRGWGHGAGLCQIGAAVMGERGYDHRSILEHYFPGTEIRTIY